MRAGAVVYERSASFTLDTNRHLSDERGNVLLDARGGRMRAAPGATIDALGVVRGDGDPRSEGTDRPTAARAGTRIASGFLERSNVDAIHEMVDVLSAQRAFETAEKTLSAVDETRAKDVNDVVRVKG